MAAREKRLCVLPDVEKTPLLLIRFDVLKILAANGGDHQKKEELLAFVEALFAEAGIIILSKEEEVRGAQVQQKQVPAQQQARERRVGLPTQKIAATIVDKKKDDPVHYVYWNTTAKKERLLRMAERIRIKKPTTDGTNVIEHFTVATMNEFCDFHTPRVFDDGEEYDKNKKTTTTKTSAGSGGAIKTEMSFWSNLFYHPFQYVYKTTGANPPPTSSVIYREENGIFSANDWGLLMFRILDSVQIHLDLDLQQIEGKHATVSKSLMKPGMMKKEPLQKFPDCVLSYIQKKKGELQRRIVSRRQIFLNSAAMTDFSLKHFLIQNEFVDVVTLRHIPKVRDAVLRETWKWNKIMPPVNRIRDYYGEEVAFYFAWIGYLSIWLVFPGLLGLFFFGLRKYRNDTIDEDEYTPFYSLFMFLWGVTFTRFWARKEKLLALNWGTYSMSQSHFERQMAATANTGFVPTAKRISPVTGKEEFYHPSYKRRLNYLLSGVVTSCMLVVAFTVMILSLNVQGFINPRLNPARWEQSHFHPFFFPSLEALAEEGHFFDKDSWKGYFPSIIHGICITILNKTYRGIATTLTRWENHETHQEFQTSLVLKRFLFEAFDCYIALFYLAFFERDMDRLRKELVAIFFIDIVRRVALETVVPTILKKYSIYKRERTRKQNASGEGPITTYMSKKTSSTAKNNNKKDEDDCKTTAAEKDEYEQFDDYMEIVIQFGYVTLFASAYPLAACIAAIDNYFEIRSDIYKLCRNSRRPRSYRVGGIGGWNVLLNCIVWLSALTNCLLVGFTSEQMKHYLPNLYIEDKSGYVHLVHDNGWLTVFIIFGLEHALILLGLMIVFLIPSLPEEVGDRLDHLIFIRSQKYDMRTAASSSETKKQN